MSEEASAQPTDADATYAQPYAETMGLLDNFYQVWSSDRRPMVLVRHGGMVGP